MTAAGALRRYIIPLLAARHRSIRLYAFERRSCEGRRGSGLYPEGGQVVRSEDTHGGCHGDGHRFIVMDFGAEDGRALAAQLEASETWKPLPFDRSLTALAYGLREGPRQTGPFVTDAAGALCSPR